ncbi:HIG1 domain-containing protein [Hellea balneolensis]|uniref:HIG1 domain-containing protein n=1 Tax=Hellea balneolensis TaxID=287478 RepID=UPI0004125244|nr:HIG1 domain-containing protein [Hellea balneolensis]
MIILWILTGAAFAFVLLTLVLGAKNMGGKTEEAREASNIWMRRRVMGQAVAVGLLLLTVYIQTKGRGG